MIGETLDPYPVLEKIEEGGRELCFISAWRRLTAVPVGSQPGFATAAPVELYV